MNLHFDTVLVAALPRSERPEPVYSVRAMGQVGAAVAQSGRLAGCQCSTTGEPCMSLIRPMIRRAGVRGQPTQQRL